MGKGLLAWWRRSIVSRGLAGAALFSVPVAVAALIGFGTGLSSVAGGLTAVTSGPDAVPASVQTTPTKLNNAVAALSNRQSRKAAENTARLGPDQGSNPGNGVSVEETGGSGSGGSGSNNSSGTDIAPTISNPLVPPLNAPGGTGGSNPVGGATGDAVNQVNGTVDNLLTPVTDTLNSLLGNK